MGEQKDNQGGGWMSNLSKYQDEINNRKTIREIDEEAKVKLEKQIAEGKRKHPGTVTQLPQEPDLDDPIMAKYEKITHRDERASGTGGEIFVPKSVIDKGVKPKRKKQPTKQELVDRVAKQTGLEE